MVAEILLKAAQSGIHLYLKDGRLAYKAAKGALTDELKKSISDNQLKIVEFLESQQLGNQLFPVAKIEKADRLKELRLSFAQQRLWLLDQIDEGSAHYNLSSALKLKGTIDLNSLNEAFTSILARHESLRTCFSVGVNNQPIQVIQPATSFAVTLCDLSNLDESERQLQLSLLMVEESNLSFNLSRDLMLRAQLIRLSKDEHVLLVTMHHIASDGWSISILINEVRALYDAHVKGEANPLLPLSIQYVDYAQWQRKWLQGENLDQQLNYWEKALAGLPVIHSLPLDHARPSLQSIAGQVYKTQIAKTIYVALRELCQSQGATLFMGLHAAFSVLLSRYSNETDIVVGSPIANREQAEIAGLIGFFVNTLVLRSDLSANPDFISLVQQSKRMLLDAYAHQQVPFEQIVERLQPERSLSHSALFQIMLVLQNNEQGILELPGLTLSAVDQGNIRAAKFDLTLTLVESQQGLDFEWEYNTDLFEESTIARMANHFELLLSALVATPNTNVFSLEMLNAPERKQVLVEWNNTQIEYPKEKCIHELFESQVENNPNAIAVTFENQQLTYGELNQKANQLAHYLINEKHVKPDTLVGICVERSLEMVVGILAILKAGGAYVPLDPEYPEARLKYMLDDASLTTVLTQSHLRETTPVSDAQAVCLDNDSVKQQLQTQPNSNPDLQTQGLTSNHLAYVIYTSGSTGNPKGVMVEHHALVNRIDWMDREYGSSPADRILQKTPFSFDVSVWEFVWPLSVGASIVLAKPEGHKDPVYLSALIRDQQITKLHFVPSMLGSILSLGDLSQCTSLQQVFCSGEALALHHVENFQSICPWAELHNLYGPTEAAIDVSYWDCKQFNTSLGSIPIGRPISNIQLHVLNPQLLPVPQHVAGELHIGGVGLARGYLNRAELTAEKFIANPFYDKTNPASSERLYKTGDLVRWLPDGNLEYLGRIDHQIKLRGFRIELGEIENALTTHEQVNDAIVLAKGEGSDKRLVAYISIGAATFNRPSENDSAANSNENPSSNENLIESLRYHLNQRLPDYMVPSAFVMLEQFPLTPNGKVDRKALPEPDVSVQQNIYVAPDNEIEKILCEIWQEVLGIERVGVNDNFFQLGGHSLLIMQVISRLQQQGFSITARQLFNAPVISELAKTLDANRTNARPIFKAPANLIPAGCKQITPELLPLVSLNETEIATIVAKVPGGAANVQDIYPLGPLQQGILFHHMMSTGSDAYILPSLFKLNSRENVNDFINALQFIINRHDTLRTAIFWQDLSVPVQVVCRQANLPVTWLKLDSLQTIEAQMRALCAPGQQWMDIGQAPLLQLQIAPDSETENYFILLQYHHIISDHLALEIIQNELAIYLSGKGDSLPVPIPYREFVAHAQYQASHNDAETFFRTMLGDLEESTTPFDLRDVNGNGSRIVEVKGLFPATVSNQVRKISKTLAINPAVLFHTAWAMVVAACSGRNDVVFGTVLSGRLQGTVGAEHMLGVFINTLPLRVKLQNASVLDAIHQIQNSLLDLLPYEQASLALAQACSGLPTGSPLFTAMINYRHSTQSGQTNIHNELAFEFLAGQERTNYPFNLSIDDFGHDFGWEIQIDKATNAECIASYVQTAVAALANALQQNPTQQINNLSVIPESETNQLLIDWNNTQSDYPKESCVHEIFELHAEKNPDAIAITFGNEQLSYGELNQKSNQLAHYLITEKHIKPDTFVGICVERSPRMVIGILAVLKAGGAYVPLDPDYPETRFKYMLEDAHLETVITQQSLLKRLPINADHALCLDEIKVQKEIEIYSDKNPEAQKAGLNATHLAYINYTSGSTGNPKGVMVTQGAVVSLVINNNYVPLSHNTVMLHNATISFDAATFEIWGALLNGGRLVIQGESLLEIDALGQFINDNHINTAWLTAGLFQQFATSFNQPLRTLKYLLVGGDVVDKHAVNAIRQNNNSIQVINGYGPTENTTFSCCYSIPETLGESVSIPIGKPLSNRSAYVLDKDLHLVPQCVAGELHVGGAGLARGYLNRADLTAEKFIANPFYDKTNPSSSERLYKTGDLVRWLPDGNLEFLGRIDSQVKIRGFRIELGEIENALSTHSAVNDAIVLVKESAAGDKRLVAYVVSEPVNEQDQNEFINHLRTHVTQALPDYMIPSAFVLLEKFPLTPNGKIDRKALPELDLSSQQNTYVAPRTETEKVLCEIWQEVLGVERVGITDNFFQLGGHSLLAVKALTAINSVSDVKLSLTSLFADATIMSVANVIESVRSNNKLAELESDELVKEGFL